MSREIKFRVWDTKSNKWACIEAFIGSDYVGINDYEDKIIQQFTGLKDDFRREVYEGDILKYSVNYTIEHGDKDIQEFIGAVKYDNTYAMFVFGANEHSMYDRINKIQVIGNVFENPELLNAN